MPSVNPRWYKEAVIYQLHLRAFSDANDDGIGDFRGLTGKLDYLQDLGVNALWLLPFYPSPWKDDGYDIADYQGIHPMYGTLHDFRTFLREAHGAACGSLRNWCSITPPTNTPGSAGHGPRSQAAAGETITSGATRPTATRTRGSSSATSSLPTGRGTRWRGPITGTASTAISPI